MKLNFKFTEKNILLVVIVVGTLAAICFLWAYPSRAVRKAYINNIIKVNGMDVEKILIEPYRNDIYPSPLKKSFHITSQNDILKFCNQLNQSYKYMPNHPATCWKCIITLYSTKKIIKFEVAQTDKQGFMLPIMSDVTSGWFYGFYRNDGLGTIIKQLIVQQNKLQSESETK